MVRGAGKFKTKRGGGRSFSRNMTLDENGVAVGSDSRTRIYRHYRRSRAAKTEDDSDSDKDKEDEDEDEESSEEEEESEEGSEEENANTNDNSKVRFATTQSTIAPQKPELTRAERRELKKKKGQNQAQVKQKQPKPKDKGNDEDVDDEEEEEEEEEDDEDLINPNHVKKKLNISDLSAPRELTRREREAKEKKEAQDRYWKLHEQGKTDQAKADLARLAKIRKEREEAMAKRKAEAEAKAKEAEAKKAAQKSGKRV